MVHITVAVLWLLAWLLPVHLPPWVSWHQESLAFIGLMLLGWQVLIAKALKGAGNRIDLPASAALPILLVMVVWLQIATGLIKYGGDAWVLTFYLFGCVVSMALGRFLSDQPNAYTLLAATLLLGAFLSVVVALVQALELAEGDVWINRMAQLRRPGGNLTQPNQLATLLLMGMASLLWLYESKKLNALSSALFALFLLIGVAATESRTGVLSFACLLLWWSVKRKSLGFRLTPWAAAIAGVGFLCMFWAWPRLMDAVWLATDIAAKSEVDTNVGTRWVVWPQLIEAVLQRPWWGWGLGQVSDALNAVSHSYAISENFTYAHNIALDLALGLGLPLAAIIVIWAAFWLWQRLRAVAQLAPWYCLALVLPVAVHSMLEFPFAYAYFLLPVMLALGALNGLMDGGTVFRLGVKTGVTILSVMTVVMVWSVVEYLAIEEDFRVVRFEALRLGTTPLNYERPRVVLLTQLDALLKGGRIVPKPGMTVDELELTRKVALRFPWPAVQNRYALSLALNGHSGEAVRQLRVIRALHGEQKFAQINTNWTNLAADKYPQLQELLTAFEP